jgi:hypothetical protein
MTRSPDGVPGRRCGSRGLAHAAYGTDGFPHGLVDIAARATLAEVMGPDAESIVYTYGSCDRTVPCCVRCESGTVCVGLA